MPIKIVHVTPEQKVQKSISQAITVLGENLEFPEKALNAEAIMPLAKSVFGLAELGSKAAEEINSLRQRIDAHEAAFSADGTKPQSDVGTKLDQRLTATSELLRATLDRLDQVETAVLGLYKPPFVAIGANDKPRKALAALRAKFNVLCVSP